MIPLLNYLISKDTFLRKNYPIIHSFMWIILTTGLMLIATYVNEEIKFASIVSFFIGYILVILKCTDDNLLNRIISYFIISITLPTIFFYINYNISFKEIFLQSFGMAFLYSNFTINELNNSYILFIIYIINFFTLSYIIRYGIKS